MRGSGRKSRSSGSRRGSGRNASGGASEGDGDGGEDGGYGRVVRGDGGDDVKGVCDGGENGASDSDRLSIRAAR